MSANNHEQNIKHYIVSKYNEVQFLTTNVVGGKY